MLDRMSPFVSQIQELKSSDNLHLPHLAWMDHHQQYSTKAQFKILLLTIYTSELSSCELKALESFSLNHQILTYIFLIKKI